MTATLLGTRPAAPIIHSCPNPSQLTVSQFLLWSKKQQSNRSFKVKLQQEKSSTVESAYHCIPCSRYFVHQEALNSHLLSSATHRYLVKKSQKQQSSTFAPRSSKAKADYLCPFCPRKFKSFPAREAHRIDVHPDERPETCPFCNRRHVSSSAVTMHLESGECPRADGRGRQQIDQYAFKATTSDSVGNGVAGSMVQVGNEKPPRLDPYQQYVATEDTKNSDGRYECYFCPGLDFHTLKQLNSHLQTPKHSNRIPGLYTCPGCRNEMQTFSGLLQHVDMASCGIRKKVEVQDALDSLMKGMASLSM